MPANNHEEAKKLLDIAREYVAEGFSVFPVPKKSKVPVIPWTKYQSERATDAELVEWFGGNKKANIGIVTGTLSGVTVVDFDTEEAITAAKAKGFLSSGPIVKTGKGLHAYCKYAPGHRNFQKRADLPGVDLRGEGGYVVAPPSTHASGHVYAFLDGHDINQPLPEVPEWVLKPKKADPYRLPPNIRSNWQDELFLLGCRLGHAGWTYEANEARVKEENAKLDDPLDESRLTSQTLASLKRYYEEGNFNHAEIPEYVTELNKKHFVTSVKGKTFVFADKYDAEIERDCLVRFSFESFRNLYNNKRVKVATKQDGTPVLKPLGNAWLEHEHRQQFEGMGLAPPGKSLPSGYYNLWKGFGVEPVKGSWKLLQKHIFYNICKESDTNFQYLMGWLAYCVQNPSTPATVAVVLKGGKGAGKSTLGVAMKEIFGKHGLTISSARYLVGNFNNHLRDCIFMLADEAYFAGDKQGEGTLKALITDPYLNVESKGVDSEQIKNMLHILMTSNNDWVIPASGDERRYFVLNVLDKEEQRHGDFPAIYHEMHNGGLEAMLFDLQGYDLTSYNIRDVPQTEGLAEQKIHSLPPLDSWWFGVLGEGNWWNGQLENGNDIIPEIRCDEVFEDYLQKVGAAGARRSLQTTFGLGIKKLLPPETIRKHKMINVDGKLLEKYHYFFPSLSRCREYFLSKLKIKYDWE